MMALRALTPGPDRIGVWADANLRGEVGDYVLGDVIAPIRKAPRELECLEQQGEAQARRLRLGGQEGPLLIGEGPTRRVLIGRPLVLHARAPVFAAYAYRELRRLQ
jgi:hypothetical protein